MPPPPAAQPEAQQPGDVSGQPPGGAGVQPQGMVPGQPPGPGDPGQLALFAEAPARHPLMDELREIDLNAMTPLEALNRLAELQRKATD